MVLNAFGKQADLDKLKTLVDNIEAEATKNHETKSKETTELKQRQVLLSFPTGADFAEVEGGEKWFTKEEMDQMSEADYIKECFFEALFCLL